MYLLLSFSKRCTSSYPSKRDFFCNVKANARRNVMEPFSKPVFLLLLNRLQNKPSAQFSQRFVCFFCFLCAIENVGADFVVTVLDSIQLG